ncbi:hypothetical protein AERO9A_380016 [Aeromonas salmonicida]|nr:hypothetical protein AERO9A_380016 [Aeromonas salmonicida]
MMDYGFRYADSYDIHMFVLSICILCMQFYSVFILTPYLYITIADTKVLNVKPT